MQDSPTAGLEKWFPQCIRWVNYRTTDWSTALAALGAVRRTFQCEKGGVSPRSGSSCGKSSGEIEDMTSNVQCTPAGPSSVTSPSGSLTSPIFPGPAIPPRPPKGTRWGGRAKGTPNKVNQSIREAIQQAFEQAGGVDYLVRLAQEDPKTFVPLLIKTLPPEPRVPQENGLNIRIDLT